MNNTTWTEVCARRLDRHFLAQPQTGRPVDAAAAMCGAHAQVITAAELSIGLRLTGGTRVAVRDALWVERSLVKTRGPRGTVHLLPARDLPMWTGALSALPTGRGPLPEDVQLTPDQTEEVVAAIATALKDAELTVDELTEAIVALTGSWAGDLVMEAFQGLWPRWRQIEHLAAYRGALCFGPTRGRKVTYTSPRRWLPGFEPAPPEKALAELLRRYLYSYGPATPAHFAQWMSVPRAWAADRFDEMGDELENVRVEGVGAEGATAWVLAGDTAAPATEPQGVRLLPYFDAYVVGCHPRELLFPGRAAERALAGGQGGNYPVLLINGVVAGVWHLRRSGRKLDITVEPLGRLSAAHRRALHDQVDRVGEFLEGTPKLTIGPVTVGGHA
jgi:hypothetical protein